MNQNVQPIFEWAKLHAEAKISDRIIIKLIPEFLKHGVEITEETLENEEYIEVPEELYELIKTTAESLVGSSYKA
ncbi:MAG: hypothetical protein U9R50_02080 [Campylobacterota bacterium]|nr:hypothetical protein [Campylobacterota bacterium]